jgi:hypothetical protein
MVSRSVSGASGAGGAGIGASASGGKLNGVGAGRIVGAGACAGMGAGPGAHGASGDGAGMGAGPGAHGASGDGVGASPAFAGAAPSCGCGPVSVVDLSAGAAAMGAGGCAGVAVIGLPPASVTSAGAEPGVEDAVLAGLDAAEAGPTTPPMPAKSPPVVSGSSLGCSGGLALMAVGTSVNASGLHVPVGCVAASDGGGADT